jgi:glycosyltransferase involved in cell wall biosynthesis
MSDNKKNILVFSDWFLPGYRAGGPIRSLANMVNAVSHQFYVVTSIKDHHSQVAYENVTPNVWTQLSANVQVMYLTDEQITAKMFEKILSELPCDKIYFNSLFSPRFTIAPLRIIAKYKWQNKVVLAPRGMLKPGALSVKGNKKKIFLFYAKWVGLYKNITWHATNEEEVNEIRNQFGQKCTIKLSPNLPTIINSAPTKLNKAKGELKLICIARISPEKGILEAIQFLKAAELKQNLVLDFYGVHQNKEYFEACLKEAQSVANASIQFKGEIMPAQIPEALAQYHFFYMTTWGENFGHAIAEALGHATPVLITNKTPWQQLQLQHAGWDLPMESALFAQKLTELYDMENDEYTKWCNGALELGNKTARNPALIDAVCNLFV